MVQFGDRGGVRACDCRVLHALMYGTPTLSWRHIIMMNTWFTRESFHRTICFNLATIKKNWKIHVKLSGSKYSVTDALGHKYEFVDPNAQQGVEEDVEMVDEEDKTEHAGPQGPKQRYMWPHPELNADVASFMNFRRVPSYRNFTHGQQEVFDNVSVGIGEGREYDKRSQNWEETH
ncbi:hypothetical protein Hanom_Chr09g00790741 [Helianthus anomalus]